MKIIARWKPRPTSEFDRLSNIEYQYYFDIDGDPDFKYCCEQMKNAPSSGLFSEILWTNEDTGELMWKDKAIKECPWCHEPIEIEIPDTDRLYKYTSTAKKLSNS